MFNNHPGEALLALSLLYSARARHAIHGVTELWSRSGFATCRERSAP